MLIGYFLEFFFVMIWIGKTEFYIFFWWMMAYKCLVFDRGCRKCILKYMCMSWWWTCWNSGQRYFVELLIVWLISSEAKGRRSTISLSERKTCEDSCKLMVKGPGHDKRYMDESRGSFLHLSAPYSILTPRLPHRTSYWYCGDASCLPSHISCQMHVFHIWHDDHYNRRRYILEWFYWVPILKSDCFFKNMVGELVLTGKAPKTRQMMHRWKPTRCSSLKRV